MPKVFNLILQKFPPDESLLLLLLLSNHYSKL